MHEVSSKHTETSTLLFVTRLWNRLKKKGEEIQKNCTGLLNKRDIDHDSRKGKLLLHLTLLANVHLNDLPRWFR